ncbi:MAG: hypothetical protein IJT59_04430 [Desulfovibrionaceae bacterium]|nr:hypothetical protein [Desulfovibrionaceae bacterium]
MEDLINKTYCGYITVLDTDTIDMINSPLSIKDQVIFGVFFLYNNYVSYNTLHETDHGHRAIIPIKSVQRVLKNVLGSYLSEQTIKNISTDRFDIVGDTILLGGSDLGAIEPIEIKKIIRDDKGLVHIRAISELFDGSIEHFKIILKEIVDMDTMSWNVLLLKSLDR